MYQAGQCDAQTHSAPVHLAARLRATLPLGVLHPAVVTPLIYIKVSPTPANTVNGCVLMAAVTWITGVPSALICLAHAGARTEVSPAALWRM